MDSGMVSDCSKWSSRSTDVDPDHSRVDRSTHVQTHMQNALAGIHLEPQIFLYVRTEVLFAFTDVDGCAP